MHPIQYMMLGAFGLAFGLVGWKMLSDRLDRIERAARGPMTIGPSAPPPLLEEMRRQSAREFVDVLREENLVITEAA